MHSRAGYSPRPLLGKGVQELLQLWPLLDVGQLAHCQQVLQELPVIGPGFLLTHLLLHPSTNHAKSLSCVLSAMQIDTVCVCEDTCIPACVLEQAFIGRHLLQVHCRSQSGHCSKQKQHLTLLFERICTAPADSCLQVRALVHIPDNSQ